MKLRQPRPGSWWKTEGQTVCEDLMPISKPRFQPGESRRQCWTGGRRRKDRGGGRGEQEHGRLHTCLPLPVSAVPGPGQSTHPGRLQTNHPPRRAQSPSTSRGPSPDRLNP